MNVVQWYPSGEDCPEILQGYTTPGYYFWEETWGYCYGPYKTETIASEACRAYARILDVAVHDEQVCKCNHYHYLHFGGKDTECVTAPGGSSCPCLEFVLRKTVK